MIPTTRTIPTRYVREQQRRQEKKEALVAWSFMALIIATLGATLYIVVYAL